MALGGAEARGQSSVCPAGPERLRGRAGGDLSFELRQWHWEAEAIREAGAVGGHPQFAKSGGWTREDGQEPGCGERGFQVELAPHFFRATCTGFSLAGKGAEVAGSGLETGQPGRCGVHGL